MMKKLINRQKDTYKFCVKYSSTNMHAFMTFLNSLQNRENFGFWIYWGVKSFVKWKNGKVYNEIRYEGMIRCD